MDEQSRIVIGRELADARAADQRRLAGHPPPSPLPARRYDYESGQLGLFDIEPVDLDDALAAFVARYRAATAEERTQLREGLGLEDAYTLLAYARRAAVFAMRSADATLVADGLAACAAVPHERIDHRDGILAVALLYRAARSCGHEARAQFAAARELGEPAFADQVDAFLARPAAGQDLRAAWGYVEAEGAHGVGLLGWGYGPWEPRSDLTGVALRVAEALRGDEYVVDAPTLASALPPVWLSGARDQDLVATLARVRAGALLHGRLRADATAEPGNQQLATWVLETAGADDASRLARLARTPRPGDALLGLAETEIFVLVVARSVVVGVPAHEDSARLLRFEPRLREAIAR